MTTFLLLCIGIVLVGLSALFSGLTIGILSLNHYELKRKAQSGNADAKRVYPFHELGHQLMITLLIGNILVNATLTILLSTFMGGVLAIVLSTVLIVVLGEILPMAYLRNHGLKLGALCAPGLHYMVLVCSPVAKPLARLLDTLVGSTEPSIYSREELYSILEEHKISNTDIEEDEAQIVRHALSFGSRLVREIMTPRRVVVSVSADEPIGPILIDELHKSGHSRFPVYNDKKAQNFIGILYLHDLVGLKQGGSAKDVMHKQVYYIHEEQPLDYAMRVFLKTNHHLLVVVNSFEEFVGVLSFEDVIEQIIGKQIVDEFDQHADLRAVAKSMADREKRAREAKERK
jgi:metal transporter CNNM